MHFVPLKGSAGDLCRASGGDLQTTADRLYPTFLEPNIHQMIRLKLINDLKPEIMLPVFLMNEEATNDLSVGHVF